METYRIASPIGLWKMILIGSCGKIQVEIFSWRLIKYSHVKNDTIDIDESIIKPMMRGWLQLYSFVPTCSTQYTKPIDEMALKIAPRKSNRLNDGTSITSVTFAFPGQTK